MIAYLYLSILGKPANYLIHFYMNNQIYFNLILVLYGVMLLVAYYNLKRIELYVAEEMLNRYSIEDIKTIDIEKYEIDWDKILSKSKFPFITTSIFFTIYRVNKKNIIKVLKRKNLQII